MPVTWEGWMVYLLYLLLLLAGFQFVRGAPVKAFYFIFYVMALSGILIFICWKKGDTIDLRWGDKNRKDY